MSRPTIKINLSKEERKELEKQIRQTKSRKMADRLRVILYKADGHGNKFIAKLLQMGRNQVSKLLQRYRGGTNYDGLGTGLVRHPKEYRQEKGSL